MLDIINASISFGNDILFSGLTIRLKKTEMACITGESGKGKSSLLNAIMGFIPLKEGTISVDGIKLSITTVEQIRRKIAWLPQELSLPSEWVSEMVAIPFSLKANQTVHFSKDKLLSFFPPLGLDIELYNKKVSEISGGQRQRIMIAVAACLEKELLIVDEPTSALDPLSVDKVIDFFRLLKNREMTILAVSHDVRFITACDSSYVL